MYEEIEKLYYCYYDELYFYIIKIGVDKESAHDIIQNTFVQAIKSIEGFKGKSSIKTWLFAIARNESYNYFRKNKRNLNIEEIKESHSVEEKDCTDSMLAREILQNIKGLKSPLKEIMQLRLIHGMSFKEIGLRVGKSENYCRVNFFRMKEKIVKECSYEQL